MLGVLILLLGMLLLGLVWQFRIRKRLMSRYPEEYADIYRDDLKFRNDLRFFRFIILKKYQALEEEELVGRFSAFRVFIILYIVVFFVASGVLISA